jgi:hypothetical protein
VIALRRASVHSIDSVRPGAVELTVELDGIRVGAIAYPELTGPVSPGDSVILNTTAVHLGLGTGGLHFVVFVEASAPLDVRGSGRVMKARYTPLQTAVETVEETHRDELEASRGLAGTPVVAAPLHSMIAHIAAGAKVAGASKVIYVMTDNASLPAGLSRMVPRLRGAGVLDGVITAGQAFGGELEAVSLWSGLLAAKEILGADVIIVADGPGNVGTDTRWGTSALNSGHALNAAEVLKGRPVAALRVSFAETRERHHGVSHHSISILRDVCMVEANVAVPTLEAPERHDVWAALKGAGLEKRHRLVEVLGWPAVHALEERDIQVTSMGRTLEEDPIFFLAAGGAGILAGRMAARSRPYREQARSSGDEA